MNIKNSRMANLFFVILISGGFFVYLLIICVININKTIMIDNDLRKRTNILKGYEKNISFAPTKEMVDSLSKEKNILENIYREFSKTFSSIPFESSPDTDPLKFKEDLIQAQNRIRGLALTSNFALPASLGFSKFDSDIPKTSEIPALKIELKIVEELIRLMLDSGVAKLDSIDISASPENRNEKKTKEEPASNQQKKGKDSNSAKSDDELKVTFNSFPVKLELRGSTESLVKFMYKLRISKFIFVVKDLRIDSAEPAAETDNMIKVFMELSANIF